MLTEEMCDMKSTLAKLAEPIKLYSQYTKNIRVKNKAAVLSDKDVLNTKDEAEATLNGKGRILLRQSGTEPVIRIMTECESEELCKELAEKIADIIIKNGHQVD